MAREYIRATPVPVVGPMLFIDGVEDIVTAGDFMDMTEGAQIIFI